MKILEVEVWALRVIEAVSSGNRVEDSRVELKSVWPEPKPAARRIAALANAAGGAEVMWLIGLDEKAGIVSHPPEELANWWPMVQAEFDELSPNLTDVVVHVGDADPITALCFSTDRAPYVVKSPHGGAIQREVPWREGTSLRSARRSDLIRILVPLQRAPGLEIVAAEVNAWLTHNQPGAAKPEDRGPDIDFQLQVTAYFTAGQGSYVVFPFRHMKVDLTADGFAAPWIVPNVEMRATQAIGFIGPQRAQPTPLQTIHDGVGQLIVEGHGYSWLTGNGRIPAINGFPAQVNLVDSLRLAISLIGVELSAAISARVVLNAADITSRNQVGAWSTSARKP
jgi:hypothetical protein